MWLINFHQLWKVQNKGTNAEGSLSNSHKYFIAPTAGVVMLSANTGQVGLIMYHLQDQGLSYILRSL
jgi:hypothetical protein